MDLPNVNPGEIIKAADINNISSSVEYLETLFFNHASEHGNSAAATLISSVSGDNADNWRTTASYIAWASHSVANTPNSAMSWLISVTYQGSTSTQQVATSFGLSHEIWMRWRGSTDWTAWTRMDQGAAVETLQPQIDAARWAKGNVSTTSNLDTYLTPGRTTFTGSVVSNRPVAGTPGILDVTVAGGIVSQEWTTLEDQPQLFVRTRTGEAWSAWLQLVYTRPVSISSGTLDTYTAPGSYRVTAGSVGGKPVTGLGWLEVIPMPSSQVIQRFTPHNVATAIYTRSYVSGAWKAWTSTVWWNGGLPTGTAFDTLVTPGVHDIQFTNHPGQPTDRAGTLTVTRGGTVTVQTFEPTTGAYTRYRRRLVSSGWEAWEEESGSGGGPSGSEPRPLSSWAPTMAAVPAADIPRAYTADRMVAFNGSHSFGRLRFTRDDGATWTDMHTFPESFGWVMPLADGELLASVGTDPSPRSLWKSTGYSNADPAAATWTNVKTASAPYIYFANAWGVSAYENIVIVAEYGPKTPTWSGNTITDPARYVYLSLDYGATWTTVFDLVDYLTTDRGLSTTDGQHLHGVAWDPWWDRIWVTFGDDTNGTVFSDDLGTTWHTADWGSLPSAAGQWQAVGIAPMENCILFGSDGSPNGVWRIDRAPGKHTGAYTIEDAWTVPDDPGRLAFLCQAIQRVPAPGGGDAAILFGFGTETQAGRTLIVGTRDGYHFTMVWQDDLEIPAGRGIRSIAGPNLRGDLIVGSNDGRTANAWTEWRGPAPTY